MITDWIDVGEVSAERDQNLRHYFYDNGVSKKLVGNNKQYLLLGRKGAGKTAVFSHLASSPVSIFASTDVIVPLSLQSYNWQAHNLLSDNQKAGGFQHRDSWRFVLYVEAVRAIHEKLRSRGAEVPKKISHAAKVLEKIFSTPVPSWTDLLGQKLFNLAKMELPKAGLDDDGLSLGGGEISFEQLRDNADLKHKLNKNVEGLTAFLESSLADTPHSVKVFSCSTDLTKPGSAISSKSRNRSSPAFCTRLSTFCINLAAALDPSYSCARTYSPPSTSTIETSSNTIAAKVCYGIKRVSSDSFWNGLISMLPRSPSPLCMSFSKFLSKKKCAAVPRR